MKQKPGPKKPRINVRLLRRIQKQILTEPKQFMMWTWFASTDDLSNGVTVNCGTAACIGGWAIALTKKTNPLKVREQADSSEDGYHCIARSALGLTDDQADRLFVVGDWPDKFRDKYDYATTNLTLAKIAVARIDHFIKTNGKE